MPHTEASREYESFEGFARLRGLEKKWWELNGYNNGNARTNGEHATIATFAPHAEYFLDIGFNEGELSRCAITHNEELKVVGFEPNERLPSSATAQRNLRIERVALSDETGSATLLVHDDANASGESSLFVRSGMNPSFRAKMKPVPVTIATLDEIAPRVMIAGTSGVFMKIDVEGGESRVLRGARTTLESGRPVFGYFEYSAAWREANERLQETFYFLDLLGYRCYRITPYGLEHIRFFDVSMENFQFSNVFFAADGFVRSIMKRCTSVPWFLGSDAEFFRFEPQLIPS